MVYTISFLNTGRIASEWGIVLSSLGCLPQDFLNKKFTVVNFKVNPSVSSDIHIWVNFPSEPRVCHLSVCPVHLSCPPLSSYFSREPLPAYATRTPTSYLVCPFSFLSSVLSFCVWCVCVCVHVCLYLYHTCVTRCAKQAEAKGKPLVSVLAPILFRTGFLGAV